MPLPRSGVTRVGPGWEQAAFPPVPPSQPAMDLRAEISISFPGGPLWPGRGGQLSSVVLLILGVKFQREYARPGT